MSIMGAIGYRLFINLTPSFPLSTLEEGEEIRKEGRLPLLDTPLRQEIGGKAPRKESFREAKPL